MKTSSCGPSPARATGRRRRWSPRCSSCSATASATRSTPTCRRAPRRIRRRWRGWAWSTPPRCAWAGCTCTRCTRGAAWQASTAALLEAAHRRGLKAGLGLQLFGASSLQNGYDLIDDSARPSHEQIAERLPRLVDGLPFDGYELSFGEFFGADPATFVATVDDAYAQLHALAPQAEVTTVIHVGDSPDQRVGVVLAWSARRSK